MPASENFDSVGAYLVVAPILMIILGFGAIAGLLWTLLTTSLMRHWQSSVRANALLVLAITAIGLMSGAGLMFAGMMAAALNEPSTTGAALSALMWPAVAFYIVLNSATELMLLCLLVFWNWDTQNAHRRQHRCLRRDVRMDLSRLCRDALGNGLTRPIPGGDRLVQVDARQRFSLRPQPPCV